MKGDMPMTNSECIVLAEIIAKHDLYEKHTGNQEGLTAIESMTLALSDALKRLCPDYKEDRFLNVAIDLRETLPASN